VRLLGPVDVTLAGQPQRVAGLRPKALLAVLGLANGELVTTDRLIDVVWDGQPPATALNTLQRHVSYLRGVLGRRDAIVARTAGYVLTEKTDVRAASQLIAEAGQVDDPAQRLTRLRAAVALWRGRPLADVAGLSWLDSQAERLETLRDDALQQILDARMELGEHAELIVELEELTGRHPYREQLHGQLMLALYRSGRQADALAAFQRLRRSLADDLGIDPGPAVRDLESAILRHEPGLDQPQPPPRASSAGLSGLIPRQLPLDIAGFAGRERHLGDLDGLLAGLTATPAVVIAVVSGTAGVGKTALAVHWAHDVANRFPDGQLYVNLRGFDPASSPMEPAEAVRGFLDAFGLPAQRLPESLDSQVAMYRSVTAGKRVLVVLDNAADSAQVRPLLPGSASCLVIVTSRHPLTGLVAAEGAYPVNLDLLSRSEAWRLLELRLGEERVRNESEYVDEIVARCARLPLALAVVAARARTEPNLSLRALAQELYERPGALDALTGGDALTDVAALFSWSYRRLSPAAARLFRLLGLHPGPDLTAAAAASLAGVPPPQARMLLAELTQANLLNEHSSGRFAFHDLLRSYSLELARGTDAPAERHDATLRTLDHYLQAAHAANRMLYPHRDAVDLPEPQEGVTVELPVDDRAALEWLTTERRVLRGAIEHAAATGFDRHAWHLAWTLPSFFIRQGYGPDWVETGRIALAAALRLGESGPLARAHRNLASAYGRMNLLDESYDQLNQALELSRLAGDLVGQAHTHHLLGRTRERQARYPEARGHAELAIALYRAGGHRRGEANALNSFGWYSALCGDYEQALLACEQALELLQEYDDRQGHAHTWHSLGYAHHHLGHHAEALHCYQTAIDLHRVFGDRYGEAQTLTHLGDAQYDVDPAAAQLSWHQALAIVDEIAPRDAVDLQARLRARNTSTVA
jgi:DNA-binding SARP family transcriptional activator